MTPKHKILWTFAGLGALAAAAALWLMDPALTASELPYHYTPEWGHRYVLQDNGSYLQIDSVLGPLQIRSDNTPRGALLLKREEVPLPKPESEIPSRPDIEAHKDFYIFDLQAARFRAVTEPRRGGIYRYDPSAEQLTFVGDEIWQRPQESPQECTLGVADSSIQYDTRTHRLELNNAPIDFVGNLLLDVAVAPGGKAAAVVSAAGWEGPNLFPFLGSPKIFGQRYHQLLSLEEEKFAANPLRLVSNLGRPEVCWPPNGDYVIYLAPFGEGLSIAAAR